MENSIYNNTMYFGSNIYDDEVVNKLLYELIGSSLDRNVKDQEIVDDFDVYEGYGSEFAVSQKTNSLYGLRADALTITISNVDIVPEGYKKRFITKYGYNKPIRFETMLTDGQLFNRVPHLYLFESYLYYGLSVVIRMDRSIVVVIDQSGPYKISNSQINALLTRNIKWQLVMERATTSYYYYGSFSSIAVSGKDAIRISSFSQLAEIMDLSKNSTNYNSWNISFGLKSTTDPYLLSKIPASITTISGSSDYAITYATGTNDILRAISGSMHILLEHRPNREKVFSEIDIPVPNSNIITLQLYGESGDPYQPYSSKALRFYAHASDNPLPNAYGYLINAKPDNIMIKDTGGIFEINISDIPNPSGTASRDKISLFVDAQVHPKSATGTKYDCPVKHSIEAQLKGVDNPFGQELRSTHYQRHSRVIGDTPYTSFQYDFEDFKTSEFKDDIRAYKLSKLKMLLNSNPDNYKKLADVLYKKTCPVRTAYLSTTEDKLPHVKDTSFIATSVRDDTLVFDEEQSYVILHSDMRYWAKPYVSLYINGVYIHPTYTGYHDFDIYVFFPKVLNQTYNASSKSFTSTAARDIVVDIYFKSSVDPKDQARSELTFNSTGSPQLLFPNGIKRSTVATKNLIAYNSATKEIIDMSNFNFYTEITTSRVKIDDNEMTITHPASIDVIYLITNDGEFFKTKDGNLIILSQETTQVPLESDRYATLGNKEIDTDNLYISLNNANYVGTAITFMSSDKPEIRKVKYGDIKIDDSNTGYDIELPEWYNADIATDPGSFKLHWNFNNNGYAFPLVDPYVKSSGKTIGLKAEKRIKITDPLRFHIYDDLTPELTEKIYLMPHYYAFGINGAIITSNDSDTWNIQDHLNTDRVYSVGYHDGVWLALCKNRTILRSIDNCNTWEMISVESVMDDEGNKIIYEYDRWFILGDDEFAMSYDGISWTKYNFEQQIGGHPFMGIVYIDETWLILSGSGLCFRFPYDLSSMTYSTIKSYAHLTMLMKNGNTVIATGASLSAYISTDAGLTWNGVKHNVGNVMYCGLYDSTHNLWIYGGYQGTILYSSDNGLTWNSKVINKNDNYNAIVQTSYGYLFAGQGKDPTGKLVPVFQSINAMSLTSGNRTIISDVALNDNDIKSLQLLLYRDPSDGPSLYIEHLPYNWNNAASQMSYDENKWEWDNTYFLPSKESADPSAPQYLPGGVILGNNLSDTYCPSKVFDSAFDRSQLPITGMPEFQSILKKYSQIYVMGARISPNNLAESRVLNTLMFNVTANKVPLLWAMDYADKFCQLFIPQMDLLKEGFYREDLFHEISKRPEYGYDMGWYNYFKALSQKIVSSDAEKSPNPSTLMTTIYNEVGKAWGWDVDYRVLF